MFEGSDTELILKYERILSNPVQSDYLDNCTVCIAVSKKGSCEVIKCTDDYHDAYLIEDNFVRKAMKYRLEEGYQVLSLIAVEGKYLMYLNALGYEINEQTSGVIFGAPSLNISYYVAKKKA